ncbi:HPt (histidine-containing phosphotransfer) domain-containing protein [Pseudomonas duriflava]|uniref:HPt (Histidine-containing phosphotransfer) domain-containing protein n=1 Tax=Pseudomonas duriflava TaxID=459528 RepID=A0A562QB05_9PSED|nr:Hpt domain-containing protein [Pseudomonas duriflava]TWI53918.1 HPt (histidine-containing phosphotransfer) domain-containing protein [Pseudomonas duriflava]
MSLPHLDNEALIALQDVMEDEYGNLLDTYILDSEERIRGLKQACEAEDLGEIKHLAHSFKGSSSNMGAVALTALCRDLEEAARRGLSYSIISEKLEQIQREFAIVRILFKSERQRYR